jgi:Putative transposase/Transposase zinc-binding domain
MKDRTLMKQILEATRDIWDQPGTRFAVRKAFSAVLDCGTPALGWEVYASDTEEKRCYHRCKSRFCASCGYRATLIWLDEQQASLPDVPYSGVVFTMPRELWPIFRTNRHLLQDLPVLAAGVIQQWISMKYGAKALIMAVPHTFGGDLKFNTHVHVLISGGGLRKSDGRWVPHLSLNKVALMRMWRYAVISHLRLAFKAHVLRSDLGTKGFPNLLSVAYQSERHPQWIIFVDQIVSKTHFLRYAARYVRRPPIATWRLLRVTATEVEFVAKDTKASLRIRRRVTLPQFVRLLAAHVPDEYRHGIRYFGLLAPRVRRSTHAALFVLLGQTPQPRPARLSWRNSIIRYFGFDPLIDSRGQEMHWARRDSPVVR